MYYSTLLVASAALIQGALSAKISTFAGPNCTGAQKDIHVYDDTSVLNIPQFQSYRENGYGSHGQRVAFYTESGLPGTCGGAKIYDTVQPRRKMGFYLQFHGGAEAVAHYGSKVTWYFGIFLQGRASLEAELQLQRQTRIIS
ncbi:hypothetical protein NM208_g3298 [Fusarium decemcellulare]|uniref:Uncharacterized protein n=1 Tax=Fusarium decemcellulare TaxID=57161 RepID=A0ACC1SPR8_9HYPO|nr:hypothetical protein NM208_g3298 [Fusarium decemcellulare]